MSLEEMIRDCDEALSGGSLTGEVVYIINRKITGSSGYCRLWGRTGPRGEIVGITPKGIGVIFSAREVRDAAMRKLEGVK